MKTFVSTDLMHAMADSYRAFATGRRTSGDETAADVALAAADAFDDIVALRGALDEALEEWDRWLDRLHSAAPQGLAYAKSQDRIKELRELVRPTSPTEGVG